MATHNPFSTKEGTDGFALLDISEGGAADHQEEIHGPKMEQELMDARVALLTQ